MKMSLRFFALLLLTLALSGCATHSCKKHAAEAPATGNEEAAETVTAPAAPEVAQEVAPAAPAASEEPAESEEPEEEKVPAAVRK